MFTDRILRDCCQQIREVEEKMEALYCDLAEKLTQPEYKKIFSRMVEEERDHKGRIDSLMARFERE